VSGDVIVVDVMAEQRPGAVRGFST